MYFVLKRAPLVKPLNTGHLLIGEIFLLFKKIYIIQRIHHDKNGV